MEAAMGPGVTAGVVKVTEEEADLAEAMALVRVETLEEVSKATDSGVDWEGALVLLRG